VKIDTIIGHYARHPAIVQFADLLDKSADAKLRLTGLIGSSPAFVAAGLAQLKPSCQLFVLSDKEEAAYFLNDLESLFGERNVLFYPDSYRRPYQIEDTDNANVLMRTEVLNKISSSSQPYVVVTYPEALAERVVTKKDIEENTFRIAVGDKLSVSFLMDLLNEYGFHRVDFVSEPGDYALRGGIVDIFSFSNDDPYRLELYGDAVESIRSFDIASQLSEKQLEHILVLPNIQTVVTHERRDAFINFLPDNTLLWFKQYQLTADRIRKSFKVAKQAYKKQTSTISRLEPEKLFVDEDGFHNDVARRSAIEFGTKQAFEDAHTIAFNTKAQPAFNKNFDLLGKDLQQLKANNYSALLFSDNAKQVERLYSIFEDLQKEVQFEPVMTSVHHGFIDNDLQLACYTDHQVFNRYKKSRLKTGYKKKTEAITLKELQSLQPGDFITHIDHGVGQFSGLEKIDVNGKMQEAIRIFYKNRDVLYVSIHSLHRIAKYVGKDGTEPTLDKLGSDHWKKIKNKTKSKVKEIAFDLIKLYAERKSKAGFQFSPDTYLQNELEASFLYEDTPDQLKATQDIKSDMEQAAPMDRLVCGDVGFGKTEIAIRAAFKAVADSKQVAVLVPTTILALQHYKTFKNRLKNFPCKVDYINRFKTSKEQKETLQRLAEGKIDIIIGTHMLAGKQVKFKDLGLLIIDEEQKFGVGVKDKLKTMKVDIDTLTLTATPIPRTLQFSLMQARDLSVINTPPPNRQPIQTEVHTFHEEIIRDVVTKEVSRGGQVFFINNRVQNIQEVAGMLQRLCPDVKVLIAHGQMKGDELEKKMMSFIDGDYDVLVATTIVESGLDIPNANTIIINNAHMFGLSDLHQMRGRVGRTNKKAYCYLLAPSLSTLTPEARKRLTAIEQFSDLGSGFQIAMKDLDIRGAGNLLGGEQSGFISEIGFEMYQKILNEAIQELKETEFKDFYQEDKNKQYVQDCQLETDLEILIPDQYIANIAERLSLYKDLDNIETETALQQFEHMLTDRFGPIPKPTQALIQAIRLRWLAKAIGFEKLILKQQKLIGYFMTNSESDYFQSTTFGNILQYVQQHPGDVKLREKNDKLSLVFSNVKGIANAIQLLEAVYDDEPVEANSTKLK
jgi:transcription-repair coupling factor (superfamily II helicase)